MEGEVPTKPSVAQLAGRLKATALPMPGNIEKSPVCPLPVRIKIKSSPLIEKLQANLSLSPTILLSPPKTSDSKLEEVHPISPGSVENCTLQPSCTEEEVPVSFEEPIGGTPLPSFNKSRARLSFKRRLPTRLHRKSASAEAKVEEDSDSCSEPDSRRQNGEDTSISAQTPAEEDRTENQTTQEKQGSAIYHETGDEEPTEEENKPSECKQEQESKTEETEENRKEVEQDEDAAD